MGWQVLCAHRRRARDGIFLLAAFPAGARCFFGSHRHSCNAINDPANAGFFVGGADLTEAAFCFLQRSRQLMGETSVSLIASCRKERRALCIHCTLEKFHDCGVDVGTFACLTGGGVDAVLAEGVSAGYRVNSLLLNDLVRQ